MRKTRRSYKKKIAVNSRHNKRAFFKYVNARLIVRPEIMAMKTAENIIVEEDIDIAETIVTYFSTVHTDFRVEAMPEKQMMTDSQIRDFNITPEMVEKKLSKLNVNKFCGPDGIHPLVPQKTSSEMCIPLAQLFRKSLDEGICPLEWKSANVTPIHKNGDWTEPSNYRSVSLTSQVCKVMESIIRDEIMKHVTITTY